MQRIKDTAVVLGTLGLALVLALFSKAVRR